jgi:hypothetical protein
VNAGRGGGREQVRKWGAGDVGKKAREGGDDKRRKKKSAGYALE